MKLIEVARSQQLNDLLEQFRHQGGVVEFDVVTVENPVSEEYECHKAVALHTLQYIQKRYSSPCFQISIDPEKPRGIRISVDQFIGPYFDPVTRRLLMRGRTSNHLNEYFYVGDEESSTNRVDVEERERCRAGYSYAFTEPPYRLRGPREKANDLFLAIGRMLFDDFSDHLTIYRWSTDWSNYFNAGHEWWGSFLWTVYNPRQNLYVGVAASTTD